MNHLKHLIICMAFACVPVAHAELSLQQLLEATRQESSANQAEMNKRVQAFKQDVARQQALLNDAKTKLAAAQRKSTLLKDRFDANEKDLAALQETLDIRLGDMGELFGVVRQVSTDAISTVHSSMVSAEKPNRTVMLDKLSQAKTLPSIDDLKKLRVVLLEEMIETGRVSRFKADVVNAAGDVEQKTVVRVGAHNLVSGSDFLTYNPVNQTIQSLPRQPEARFQALAGGLSDAKSGVVPMAVDPVLGQFLGKLIQKPTMFEKVKQGGGVGAVIIVLGVIGLLITLWRVLVLTTVGSKVRKQSKTTTPNEGNPLGRVLKVAQDQISTDVETLELKLDEAILKETPRLERGQVWIKLIAAVAPLLGLLGTVVGMIDVFQDITLFGTGDPKLMAGGISKALVTTMLGLVVAIPLVILHSFVAGRSRNVIEVLEEQSAGLIARRAEKRA